MPQAPKPPGQRVRRNKGQPQWRQLPAAGREGEPPRLPGKVSAWLKGTREWWVRIWASPMAVAWEPADVDSLVRLARLKDDFDRGDLPVSAYAAMQQLEDRFGLSPKARRALQWEIAREQPAEEQRPTQRRHLRAVDPRAVAGS